MDVPGCGWLAMEARAAHADVGFVQPGQRAAVKVEAFPFTRRGLIEGTVRTLSADADSEGGPSTENPQASGSPVTLGRITLDATHLQVRGRAESLSAAMAVTAQGERRAA